MGAPAKELIEEKETMSKTAKEMFLEEVNRLMAAGREYDDAWTISKLTNRALYNEMCRSGQTQQQRDLANELARFSTSETARREREAQRVALVNSNMARHKCDYDTAWSLAKIENPALFNEMGIADANWREGMAKGAPDHIRKAMGLATNKIEDVAAAYTETNMQKLTTKKAL